MAKQDFNDNAMSFKQFLNSVEVEEDFDLYGVQEIHPEDGEVFNALAIANGGTFKENGKTRYSFTFFTLSKNLTEKGEVLTQDFIDEHFNELMLIEPQYLEYETVVNGKKKKVQNKFGVLFLRGGKFRHFKEDFAELFDE